MGTSACVSGSVGVSPITKGQAHLCNLTLCTSRAEPLVVSGSRMHVNRTFRDGFPTIKCRNSNDYFAAGLRPGVPVAGAVGHLGGREFDPRSRWCGWPFARERASWLLAFWWGSDFPRLLCLRSYDEWPAQLGWARHSGNYLRARWCSGRWVSEVCLELSHPAVDGLAARSSLSVASLRREVGHYDCECECDRDHRLSSRPRRQV